MPEECKNILKNLLKSIKNQQDSKELLRQNLSERGNTEKKWDAMSPSALNLDLEFWALVFDCLLREEVLKTKL